MEAQGAEIERQKALVADVVGVFEAAGEAWTDATATSAQSKGGSSPPCTSRAAPRILLGRRLID